MTSLQGVCLKPLDFFTVYYSSSGHCGAGRDRTHPCEFYAVFDLTHSNTLGLTKHLTTLCMIDDLHMERQWNAVGRGAHSHPPSTTMRLRGAGVNDPPGGVDEGGRVVGSH